MTRRFLHNWQAIALFALACGLLGFFVLPVPAKTDPNDFFAMLAGPSIVAAIVWLSLAFARFWLRQR